MSLRVGIDIGGTFTDLVAISNDGIVTTHKTASTPHDYGEGIIVGLQALLADRPGVVGDVLHATTVGSNTVLEAKGAASACRSIRSAGPSRALWSNGGCAWKSLRKCARTGRWRWRWTRTAWNR